MSHGGRAVARSDGQVVFVDGAYPGETVRVEITKTAQRHLVAQTLEVLEPSPERIMAPCPHFGPCGGCQWQTANYSAQLRWKQEIVADQLRFVGKLPEIEVLPTMASGPEYGYRNRMDFKVRDGRPALNRAESHDLIPLEVCLLLAPSLRTIFDRLELLPGHSQVTLRGGVNTGESLVLFDGDRGRLHERVGEVTFQISDRAFFQTNTAGAERLVQLVGEILDPRSEDRLLDGYAGGGLFSATVGGKAKQVWAVESDPTAIEDLRTNAPAEVVTAKFERSLKHLPESLDLAVVDPPRDGLGRAGVEVLVAGRPRRIAYVSCDPATFARDAAWLVEAGFHLDRVQPVDMFPQTFHIELVGAFSSTLGAS